MARKSKIQANMTGEPLTADGLKNVRDRGYGRVLELGGADVVMLWNLSEKAEHDQTFKLIIGSKEYYFDAEQFRKYLRWV